MTGPHVTGPHVTGPHTATSRARISALTDVGRTREHNEDAFLVADLAAAQAMDFPPLAEAGEGPHPAERSCDLTGSGVLLLVADGLGGAAAGEVASHLAARVAHEALRRALAEPAVDARDPLVIATVLRDAVLAANEAVHRLGSERAELHGMASTITAAYLRDDGVTVAQVGDSRAYVVRGSDARQITKDQSLVQRLVDAGEMTPEQAETSMRRNIILQALGPETTVRVDVTRQTLCEGDLVLLCSDGLSGQLRGGELGRIAGRTPEPGPLCAALVEAANVSGGPDNITVVVARVSGTALAPAPTDSAPLAAPNAATTPPAGDCEDVAPHPVPLADALGDGAGDPTDDGMTADMLLTRAAARAAATVGPSPGAGFIAGSSAAAGITGGELASRRGRVRAVYALLGAAAVAAAVWTWYAFAR